MSKRRLYGYYINLDERGEFFADVRDVADNSIYEVDTHAAAELITNGFVKDVRNPAQIEAYLKEIRLIGPDDSVLSASEFERRVYPAPQKPAHAPGPQAAPSMSLTL